MMSSQVQEMQAMSVNNYVFKIMTWNVWFDILEIEDRMAYIIDQVLRMLPDVACFQEVVPKFAEMLHESRLLKEQHYIISPYEPVHNYGNITIVKHKATFQIVDFPNSKMGRKLTLATFKINKISSIPEIKVGNVHLESLNNRSKRVEQLVICRDNLPPGSSILTGDFNISANDHVYRDRAKKGAAAESTKQRDGTMDAPAEMLAIAGTENDAVMDCLPGFTDAWLLQVPILHARYAAQVSGNSVPPVLNVTPEDPVWEQDTPSAPPPPPPIRDYYALIDELGYTYDTVKNTMNGSAVSERKRIDRVMTSLDPQIFHFQEMHLLGTEAIAVRENNSNHGGIQSHKSPPRMIFASDHYGLLCTYNIQYASEPESPSAIANECSKYLLHPVPWVPVTYVI